MEWLTKKKDVSEKKWVVQKLDYFRAFYDFDSNVSEIDWSQEYKCRAIERFLSIIKDEESQQDIDSDTFYANRNINEDNVRRKLYVALGIYGQQGKHSKDIMDANPERVEVRLAMKELVHDVDDGCQ